MPHLTATPARHRAESPDYAGVLEWIWIYLRSAKPGIRNQCQSASQAPFSPKTRSGPSFFPYDHAVALSLNSFLSSLSLFIAEQKVCTRKHRVIPYGKKPPSGSVHRTCFTVTRT